MTKDDVLRMAREAGFVVDEKAQQHQPNCVFHTHHMVDELLERFAALVTISEREAILQMSADNWYKTQKDYDSAIRARGETK